jgi:hypothetical protein
MFRGAAQKNIIEIRILYMLSAASLSAIFSSSDLGRCAHLNSRIA